MANIARTPAEVIAGEAVSGPLEDRWADMVAIASVLANRAALLGVSIEDVVGTQQQFNAYNKQLPAGAQKYVDLAQKALSFVEQNGPVTSATFYATPSHVKNLPEGLAFETETPGHRFFSDPEMRSIRTAIGSRLPDADNQLTATTVKDPLQTAISMPYTADGLTNGVTSMMSPFAPPQAVTSTSEPAIDADPAFGANGLLNGVPETLGGLDRAMMSPSLNGFSDLAAAGPISAPMNVSATGILGNPASLAASANAGMLGITPSAENYAGIAAPASATVSMPSFDVSRFGDVQPSVANFDNSRFGDPSIASFDASRFGPTAVDQAMATPTAINPSTPSVNSFSDLAAAGPMGFTPTGILSQEHQQIADKANQNFADMQSPSLTAYTAPTTQTAAEKAIDSVSPLSSSSLFSPASIENVSAPITGHFSVPSSVISTPTVTGLAPQYSSFVPSDVSTTTIDVAKDPAVAMPSLQTVSVPEQPSIAGPIDTPAVTQQKQQQQVAGGAFPEAPTTGILGGLNTGMLTGGILGSIAAGPVGGILGGLIGNKIAKNGGLSGILGGQPMSINNIGGGLNNVASVYGGAPPGTQANTNNGGFVTALGGGWTAYTNPNGVTTTEGPSGQHASYFGPSLTGDNEGDKGMGGKVDTSGFSPGLW